MKTSEIEWSAFLSSRGPGSAVQPEPPLLPLFRWHLQPHPSPDPFDPFHVYDPAGIAQQSCDPPIAIARILRDRRDETLLVGTASRDHPLGRSVLGENAAGEAFRDLELLRDTVDTRTAEGGAQKFPEAASRKISFSSVRSDTTFRSRSFSFSSSFSRLTWFFFSPPYFFCHLRYVNCVPPIDLTASATDWPCDTNMSTCRSFAAFNIGVVEQGHRAALEPIVYGIPLGF